MIQQLLLTLFITSNKQTKHHNWILSLLKQLCVNSPLLHNITIHVFASLTLPYFMYFIQCALEFGKSRIKLLGWHSKASRAYFLMTSHCISLYLHSEATMMPVTIHSQQEQLICMLTQQGLSLAVTQVAVSFLLSLLIYTFCVWEAVNVSM